MAGQNTVLFLFNKNDKIRSDTNKVTFIFGEPLTPCAYPILIDDESNLFEMGCNCHLIDYTTNIITINCDPRVGAPDCIYWDEQEIGTAPFDCPCIPWSQTDPESNSTDFTIGCSGNDTDRSVILGAVRSYFGTSSQSYFSVDFDKVESHIGLVSNFTLAVANMRFDGSQHFGYSSNASVARIHTFVTDLPYGYSVSTSILYDPYHKFFNNDEDSASSQFGYAVDTTFLYDPYHKLFYNDEDFSASTFGFTADTFIIYDPHHKFFNNDASYVPFDIGWSSRTVILYDEFNKFSEVDLFLPWGFETNSKIVYDPYHELTEDDITSKFGVSSSSIILFDQWTQFTEDDILSYFETYKSTANIVFDPYNELTDSDLIVNFGWSSNTFILYDTFNILWDEALTVVNGWQSNVIVVYDPYNSWLDEGETIDAKFGWQAHTTIVYDPYNNWLDDDEFFAGGFGFDSQTLLVFDPYHEFFPDPERSAQAVFGYAPASTIVYDPYHEFFVDPNASVSFVYGHELKNLLVFDPYNKFNEGTLNPFVMGYAPIAEIRYSDDHRISVDDIQIGLNIASSTEMKYANVYAYVGTDLAYGFTSTNVTMISPGFICNIGMGYSTNIRYLTYRVPYPTFGIAISSFGYELHDNGMKPRYFDLSKNVCCTKKPYELHHIEMMDNDEWNVLYGNEHGWGFGSYADLQAQPRIAGDFSIGLDLQLVENIVYLDNIEFAFGTSMHTRGLQFATNIELSNANFITDQNEIKVELTKPDEELTSNRTIYFGLSAHTSIGATYALYPGYHQYYGHYSYSNLSVEEALRGSFAFGISSQLMRINNDPLITPRDNNFGFSSIFDFYEPPVYVIAGFSMECSGMVTENWVEFLEEGELNNDYLFQNVNGDIDHTRPNGESIEGYPYARYIKGRCY